MLAKHDDATAGLDAAIQARDVEKIKNMRHAVEVSLDHCSRVRERLAAHEASHHTMETA